MSKVIKWIKDNSPVTFNTDHDGLKAYILVGGQPTRIPIPSSFLAQGQNPAVEFAKELLSEGPMQTSEFVNRMKRAGFSRKDTAGAREYLDLVSTPSGFQRPWTIYFREVR